MSTQLDPAGQLPPHTPVLHTGGVAQPQCARYGGAVSTAPVHTSDPVHGTSHVVHGPLPPVKQKQVSPTLSQW